MFLGGKLRKLDPKTMEPTNQGFDFNISDDPQYNQKRYEALGEVRLIYRLVIVILIYKVQYILIIIINSVGY